MATPEDGEGKAEQAPQPMLTVAAVARRLGVAPSTLRTWDRRYKLGPSAHTAGSHRRYSPSDVARLVVMRRLTLEGVPPGEAAQLALTSAAPGEDAATPAAAHLRALASGTVGNRPAGEAGIRPVVIPSARRGLVDDLSDMSPLADLHIDRGETLGGLPERSEDVFARSQWAGSGMNPRRAGGGRVVALPEGTPQARGLARAAMSLDSAEVSRLIRAALREHGVARTWTTMAMPVLQAIGERWRVTGDGVDVEHAFSEALLAELRILPTNLRRPRNTSTVLLACAEGDHHTLPLHVLAAALAEEDIACRMLGVGLPPKALVAAVRRSGPAVVFLYARLPVLEVDVLDRLPRQRPAPRVVVGGTGWVDDTLPPSVVRVETLDAAVEEILTAVHV